MRELRDMLADLGCSDVMTYIQSGNVVFRSAGSRARLEDAIAAEVEARFGFRPAILVLDRDTLEQAVRGNPWPAAAAAPATLHAWFLAQEPAEPDLRALRALCADQERFELRGQVFYLHAPDGIGRSKLAARVEKTLGVPATSRNWRSVLKLRDMAAALRE